MAATLRSAAHDFKANQLLTRPGLTVQPITKDSLLCSGVHFVEGVTVRQYYSDGLWGFVCWGARVFSQRTNHTIPLIEDSGFVTHGTSIGGGEVSVDSVVFYVPLVAPKSASTTGHTSPRLDTIARPQDSL